MLLFILAMQAAGGVQAKVEKTAQLGGACGEDSSTIVRCGSGTQCVSGTCEMQSNLSDSDRDCKAKMANNGYSQNKSLNYPAIHGGFCYIDRDTPGMYNAIYSSREEAIKICREHPNSCMIMND